MTLNAKPGFQSSDTTYVEVIIYQHGTDPVVLAADGILGFEMNGQKPGDPAPSIVSVQTQKQMGAASGSFSINVKPSQAAIALFDKLVDDDWVDIVFYKHGDGYHVMRGMLDEVKRSRSVSGNGATSEMFMLSGRDFGKVWENTPVWFSPFANDFITQAVSNRIFDGVPSIYGSPGRTPITFLRDFMEALTDNDGVNWTPPLGIPGLSSLTFTGNVAFNDTNGESQYFQNIPMRNQYNPNGMNPDGMLWQLAYEYSDPMFTELYTDLLPDGDPLSPRLTLGDPLSTLDTKMSVVLRDKPFQFQPTSVPPGFVSLWDLLPTHTVNRHEIISDDVAKSGFERYNAFFVAPRILQEALSSHALYVIAPLIDRDSIKYHGWRRMDIQSNVVPDPENPELYGGPDVNNLCSYQRQLLRDWYCMNPYLLSGTFVLGHGRPDIKIGNKMSIPGGVLNPTDVEADETYYVESVTNSWQAGMGIRTSVGVTRGWVGTDAEYLTTLSKVADRYTLPSMALTLT